MPRTFVAFDLDDASLDAMAAIGARLAERAPRRAQAKWSTRAQLHVTAKFLGSTTEEQSRDVGAWLARYEGTPAPRVRLARLDAFPFAGRARVLIGALEDASGALASIARDVEEHAATLGFPREARAYVPHVTFARLREPTNAREWLARAAGEPRDVGIVAIALYRSDAGPQGSVYTALATAHFAS
jgi:2'-5' RNA ligase